jgi:hypothetical protein
LKAAILLGSVWFAFGSALIIIAAYPSVVVVALLLLLRVSRH